MTLRIIDGIKKFQEHLLEIGLARAVLALPAPRMLSLPSPTAEGAEPVSVFEKVVTEPEIYSVSGDLFASGYYNISVCEAFKAVEKYIQSRVPEIRQNGTTLMDQAFSPSNPALRWSDLLTNSEIDEQKGYQRLFSGSMLGIRNPTTHEFDWVDEPDVALELIVFAQHLIRKAKQAEATAKGDP
ncbi:TIGR02391 family protein [Novosphingobium sp.]|jgi:uncharacterized protein (TIGR02391 family)|uniref:TIGR02391 family protein n=1 Tax=Novosphingobium sp. TaxID=1874826 RepID=UPI0022CA122D|nr:TIGR02391 family protein [Novosphingobium sp.]MCZ8019395.1 TIGR02391 family protein [Novosphingobium sp.]MCZ8035210.1 TIGR02391 family protein [Novosphingobium sp.]MCZ8050524.1 TIGR02391 family protein [Novosphingobium sp.]MCZ8058870.1 TIGR02391 family protein [Novosphingobium sp.]MCZ8232315.1 TIGR02391 family protein [Novosphingobium sp.]